MWLYQVLFCREWSGKVMYKKQSKNKIKINNRQIIKVMKNNNKKENNDDKIAIICVRRNNLRNHIPN